MKLSRSMLSTNELATKDTIIMAAVYHYYKYYRKKSRYEAPVPYNYFIFDLDALDDRTVRHRFRFTRTEIKQLVMYLKFNEFEPPHRLKHPAGGTFYLCVVLRRLAHPSRWQSLQLEFGRSMNYLSIVFNHAIQFIHEDFKEIMTMHPMVTYQAMCEYGTLIEERCDVDGTNKLWGFIDGTTIPVQRPLINTDQRRVYKGHKKHHCIKLQVVTAPNGIMVSIMGPYEGYISDNSMVRHSGIEELSQSIIGSNPAKWIYGDGDYGCCTRIMGPFAGRHALDPAKREVNTALSNVTIAAEMSFGLTKKLFKYITWKDSLNIGQQPVGLVPMVALFLANCFTCYRRNAINTLFGSEPPTIEEYLMVSEATSTCNSSVQPSNPV